jgi:hypothetical protein
MFDPCSQSRPFVAALFGCSVAVSAFTLDLNAQAFGTRDASPTVSQLRKRADSLIAELGKATAAVVEQRRRDSLQPPVLDTLAPEATWVQVGSLRILTDTVFTALVTKAARQAWTDIYDLYGSEADRVAGMRSAERIAHASMARLSSDWASMPAQRYFQRDTTFSSKSACNALRKDGGAHNR